MTGQDAAKFMGQYMWEYEKTEVLEHETVYFFNVQERLKQSNNQQLQQIYSNRGGASGPAEKPQRMGVLENGPNIYNYGFDNEQQEYIVIMNEHIAYRYEIVKKLGKGSFGIVLRAFDHKTKEFVALKILKN